MSASTARQHRAARAIPRRRLATGIDRLAESARHADRIGRLGDSGVQEHGVKAELHDGCRVRWPSEPRIHNQRNAGEMSAHRAQRHDVDRPESRSDRRAPWHQNLAARLKQPFGDDEVVRGIGEYRKAIFAEDARGIDQAEHVRLERVMVADHFELDPRRAKNLARHLRGRDGFLHGMTAGGVRQDPHAERVDQRPEFFAAPAASHFTAQRDRHHRGARRLRSIGEDGRRRILGCA
ncbi:hypothetical protein AU467_23015 [Mesorhizobium loti]|uniref:Uncharacterized protein n=1 Tax=Rhizobium loti TaxID=381 RepID=A0A101KSS2_RHILI|nr:hypothetical protein AU467_23015 [Mesorhizobium loti]